MSEFRRRMMAYAASRTGEVYPPNLVAAWSAKGKSNDDADRAVLKDLTGNGHDIALNNFAFNGDSGYGNPEYPDALVFDGVDDYGVCSNMPILTDYTVIVDYNIIKYKSPYANSIIAKEFTPSASGIPISYEAFQIKYWPDSISTSSFYKSTTIKPIVEGVIYQSKNSFNGASIESGTNTDTHVIGIGVCNLKGTEESPYPQSYDFCSNIAFRSAYVFNRSLSESEIKSFARKYIDPEYLLPSEVPTPDCYYDFSLGSNTAADRETVKDLSGNGKNAKIYNSAFNEDGSGYKDGALFTDGVDDYVALEAFDSGFSTIFMVCTPSSLGTLLYDQRKDGQSLNPFTIYNFANFDKATTTYINGVESIYTAAELVNKKHCITMYSTSVTDKNTITPIIGVGINSSSYAKMAIYKFLGFKEALTEEQIQAVIKKYNLLDKVDEI